jgi:hypothetical protein
MQRYIEHTNPNMVGINKLAQAIERVGFVPCQFTLWVVPEEWFNSEQEPDFGEQAIVVCFFGYTLRFAPGYRKMYRIYYAFCDGYRKMYSIYYVFCKSHCKMYSIYYVFCDGRCKMYSIYCVFCNGCCKMYSILRRPVKLKSI